MSSGLSNVCFTDYKCCELSISSGTQMGLAITLLVVSLLGIMTSISLLVAQYHNLGFLTEWVHFIGVPITAFALGVSSILAVIGLIWLTRIPCGKKDPEPSYSTLEPQEDSLTAQVSQLPLEVEESGSKEVRDSSPGNDPIIQTAAVEPPVNQTPVQPPIQISQSQSAQLPKIHNQDLADSFGLFVKTITGTTLTIHFHKGQSLREAITAFKQENGIWDFSLIFAGRDILTDPIMHDFGDHDAFDWLSKFDVQSESIVFLILKKGGQVEEKESQKKPLSLHFKTSIDPSFFLEIDPDATLNDCCHAIAKKAHHNPASSCVSIFFGGKKITNPARLNRTILSLDQEFKFTHLFARIISLSDLELLEVCKLFEKYQFPGFECRGTLEKTLEYVRLLMWSECSRVLEIGQGAGSLEIEKQLQTLKKIVSDSDITPMTEVFVKELMGPVLYCAKCLGLGISEEDPLNLDFAQ